MSFAYLAALLISISGLALIDWRAKLVVFADARRAIIALAIGVGFFLLWDVAGIALGIFFRGTTPFLTGILIAPELPLEELLFLTLLCYQSLILFTALSRRVSREASS